MVEVGGLIVYGVDAVIHGLLIACVVAEEGVSGDYLDAFCLASDTLARFKRPREYRFVPELPKSSSGKILRRMLRESR